MFRIRTPKTAALTQMDAFNIAITLHDELEEIEDARGMEDWSNQVRNLSYNLRREIPNFNREHFIQDCVEGI